MKKVDTYLNLFSDIVSKKSFTFEKKKKRSCIFPNNICLESSVLILKLPVGVYDLHAI